MDYENFGKQTLTSSSHLTVSQNIELRNLLNDCNRMACNGQLVQWRWKLDAIQRELNFDMVRLDAGKNDTTTFSKRIDAIELKISKSIKNKELFYKYLAEKEVVLRELQEKSGKGTKRTLSDDDDDE